MQTPAEVHLIERLAGLIRDAGPEALVLSAGAGRSLVIEGYLLERGVRFSEDRVDLVDPTVAHPVMRRAFQCSVEAMAPVPSATYDVAFSNYLLEHVERLAAAAAEVHRVLKPGGHYVASVPNPTAPEFVLARHTPLWFHRLVRGHVVGEKYYSYRDVPDLVRTFERAGFEAVEVRHWSSVEDYLQRVPVANLAARAYDRAVMRLGWRRAMGNACCVFRKPAGAPATPPA